MTVHLYFFHVGTNGIVVVNLFNDDAKKYISSSVSQFHLDVFNPDNVLLTTIRLVSCSGTYLGNITYPQGRASSVRLRGRDYLGYGFQYQRNTSSQLSFSAHPCKYLTLVPRQSSGVVVASGKSRIFSFSLLVTASTTPVEIRISTVSNSDRIRGLVLMNGSVISSEAIATIYVNLSASKFLNGSETVSFSVHVRCGCNVNNTYKQVFQISSVMVSKQHVSMHGL